MADNTGRKHRRMKAEPGKYKVTGGVSRAWIKPPKDHEVYSLIGRVIAEWGHFENVLDEIICDLTQLDPKRGACLTAQLMGAWPKLNSIRALLHYWIAYNSAFTGILKKLNKFSGDCHVPSERRNRIVHDAWMFEVSPEAKGKVVGQHRAMPKSKPTYGIEDVDVASLTKLVADIQACTAGAIEIKHEIMAVMPARD